jgi:dephospho-CoA kinase
MDGVVVVWVPREVQKARLMARDGLAEDAAEARLAAQLPLDEKRQHATWLVDNSGGLEATRAQVERIWREIQARG